MAAGYSAPGMKLDKYIAELLNSLGEGVLILDEHANITYRNRAAEKILGIKIDLRERGSARRLFGSFCGDLYEIAMDTLSSGQTTKNREIACRRGNREARVLVAAHPCPDKKRRDGVALFIVLRDITELWRLHSSQRRLVSQLRKNYTDQLDNLRQIAESVAHELRNPIVTIGGYVNLLFKKLRGEGREQEEYGRYLGTIREETDRLATIVTQVERYTDLNEVHLKRENMVRIIQSALRRGRTLAAKSSVSLVAPELDLREYHIYVDRDKIKSAYVNLLKNSILLSKKEKPVQVHYSATPYELCLSVDVKTSLLKEDVPFLFNPFYSAGMRELNFELAASQRIAILHGGIIDTLWQPEDNLTFRFTIPKEKRLSRG